MMKWLRYILSIVVLITGITVRGQYNPDNPPEPGSKYTLHLRVYPDDSGSFSPSSGGSYEPGSTVNVRASAASNFKFLHWEDDRGDVVSNTSSFGYVMPMRDVTLTARFSYSPDSPGEPAEPNVPKYSNLYVSVTPTDAGTVNVEAESRRQVGSTVRLHADTNTGFVFKGWVKDGIVLAATTDFDYIVTAEDAHIVATYAYSPGSPDDPPVGIVSHKVYVDCYPEGACWFNRESVFSVIEGDKVEVRAYPYDYYHFVNWTCDGEPIDGGTNLSYMMPDHEIHLTANFTYDYRPSLPDEPESAQGMAAVYGLTDYVAIKERHMYPIYLDNTLHKAKGMVIDVQFPRGFEVEIDNIQTTRITETHNVSYEVVGDNNYRITTLGTENTLEKVTAIAMFIPVNIPDTAQVDSTYFVRVHYGVLTNMDNSQTPLKTHNGGLRVMDEGYCLITTSMSQYGTIEGGGKYKFGETVTLTATPYEGYEFIEWTDGTTANPYVFEAQESMVIGAVFRDLGFVPDYPVIDDLTAEAGHDSVTLGWSAPDLTDMWQGCIEALVPEDELPQLVGYNVYRNGVVITPQAVTDTTYVDTDMDIFTSNVYTVTSVYSDGRESQHSNEAVTSPRVLEQCPAPELVYNGRYLHIIVPDDYTVYYTIDDSEPIAYSPASPDSIDVGGIVDIRAITVRDDYADSDEATLHVPVYFDGETVTVDEPGTLHLGFGWCTVSWFDTLVVRGNIDTDDLSVATAVTVEKLDLREANIAALPSEAFAGALLRHLITPASVSAVGERLFAGCPRLTAVEWTSQIQLSDAAMEGCQNPNMLVYVESEASAPQSWTNVVVDGRAATIVLTDSDVCDFYCPVEFTAAAISYTHYYGKTSAMDAQTAGWEALTVPFDVMTVEHETAGQIVPFAANSDYWAARPFWLETFGENGFEPASEILANTPYLVCMPNNDVYDPRFILAGNVTYRSEYVTVPVTAAHISVKGEYSFVPTTVAVPVSDRIALINHEAIGDPGDESYCVPGEVFVAGMRNACPFEAYITKGNQPIPEPLHIAPLMSDPTGIADISIADDMRVYVVDRVLHIEVASPMTVGIYTPEGIMIHRAELQPGDNIVSGLPTGIYIVGTSKVLVR